MNETTLGILIALTLPLLGTTVGSAFAFFLKKEMNDLLQKVLLGFAAGVMIAASIWSLLMPAIEMAEEQQVVGWVPAALGFLLGMGFLLLFDHFLPHQHIDSAESREGPGCNETPYYAHLCGSSSQPTRRHGSRRCSGGFSYRGSKHYPCRSCGSYRGYQDTKTFLKGLLFLPLFCLADSCAKNLSCMDSFLEWWNPSARFS